MFKTEKNYLNLKKKKWERLIYYYKKKLSKYRRFNPQNQNLYLISKYPNRGTSYNKKFRKTLHASKRFRLFYGGMKKKILKHKIKFLYNKKFKNLNNLLLNIFESRLDTVIYRAKFSNSMRNAQQLILHGKILVNNQTITNKSYILKSGDLITVNPHYHNSIKTNIINSNIWPIPLKHLLINYKTLQILFVTAKNINISHNFHFNLNLEKILINYLYQ